MDRKRRDLDVTVVDHESVEEDHRDDEAGSVAVGLFLEKLEVFEDGNLRRRERVETGQLEVRAGDQEVLLCGLLERERNNANHGVC